MITTFDRHIKPVASLKQLALPESQADIFHGIVANVRHTGAVVLFTGQSETDKTLAAEALGHELQTDLYRIDLRAVASKWVGETEENLNRLLDNAERSSAVLLFDEADALFDKRADVKDSHDRFAGSPALVERVESYRPLVILNFRAKDSFEPAMLARVKFIVDFLD